MRVEREQQLDAGVSEFLGDQPPGSVGPDAADDRCPGTQASRGERGVRGGPTGTQRDAAVAATARNGHRQGSVEHHVAHGDQILRHERTILCSRASLER